MANISEKLNEAMNDQIKEELESAYIYLGMAAWFEERSLDNLAAWFDKQAEEEFEHAMKFKAHILERGGTVHYHALAEQKQLDLPNKVYKRMCVASYQALRNIYLQRKNHRHPDWQLFCEWIKTLPYSKELITLGA